MADQTLVKRSTGESGGFTFDHWEPAFFDCQGKLCPELPSPELKPRYLDFLHHQVARRGNDLTAHVRRIMLSLDGADHSQLTYKALYDLFSALGNNGQALRARMLERCRGSLTSDQAQTLQNALDGESDGVGSADRIAVIRRSDPLLQVSEKSLLDDVRDHLENGQVDLAQSMLEQALQADANNAELTRELLEIYRRSRHTEAALRTRANLGNLSPEVRKLWDDMLGPLEISL